MWLGDSVEISFLKNKSSMKNLQPLCVEFAKMAEKKLNWKHWHSAVGGLVQNKLASCLVLKDGNVIVGMLCWSYFPDLITAELSATEICWYIDPDYRSPGNANLMINAMESEARIRQCKFINMVCLESIRSKAMGRFYITMGYRPIEQSFQKEL